MWKRTFRATCLTLAAAAGVCTSPALAKKDYKTPASAEDFREILKKLSAEAKRYAEAKGDQGPAVSSVVANLQYTPDSAEYLEATLKSIKGKPLAQWYASYQLLQPLSMSGDELLRKLQPLMARMLARCQYRTMPVWPKYLLNDLTLPKKKRIPSDIMQRLKARQQKVLARKRTAEQEIVKHNRMVNALEKTLKSLLVVMSDKEADEAVLRTFQQEARRRLLTYEDTLSAVKGQAVRMEKERAKRYYDRFISICRDRAAGGKRAFFDPTNPNYSATDNSTFHSEQKHFAAETLKVVNLLATSAREPAVIVPGDKPIKRKPRKTPRRR